MKSSWGSGICDARPSEESSSVLPLRNRHYACGTPSDNVDARIVRRRFSFHRARGATLKGGTTCPRSGGCGSLLLSNGTPVRDSRQEYSRKSTYPAPHASRALISHSRAASSIEALDHAPGGRAHV